MLLQHTLAALIVSLFVVNEDCRRHCPGDTERAIPVARKNRLPGLNIILVTFIQKLTWT